ncbi:Polyamine transporter 4 [Cyphellophora attinorum]|uniref:Polyamine transporter 4 n=1 Tax=Cyphellophora attinorum TaxID=1664694 RepID=A0A0N1HQD4_9EURO|nr:Polyamine transporter 4 [Phialophora attinorum]KPI40143.1 Polyamine transporter 4 [Phialophora attinorum]
MTTKLADIDGEVATIRDCKDWNGEDDPDNARNWSRTRKVISTAVICLIGFNTTMGASIYAPGHEDVKREFGVSTTVSLLPLSSYSLGLAFGPMISSPLSETFGRKFVYLLTLPLFDIFVLGFGLSQSIGSLIACRFLAGMFAAPGVSVASATIADYIEPERRAFPLAFYYTIPFIGSAIGPLIGGFAVAERGWRWTAWIILIISAVFHPPALYLRESYKTIILQRLAKRLGVEGPSGPQRTVAETFKEFMRTTILRPLHMLLTEPLVGFICLYTGFQFALLYTFVVASPWVFQHYYGFSTSAQGLTFLGLIVGCLVAPCVLIAVDKFLYQPRLRRLRGGPELGAQYQKLPPEDRLFTALYGSLVLPVALFWFAWSAGRTHWLSPVVAQGVAMLGSILIYVPCNFFMLDVYGSKYGASSAGASSLSRYTLSAAFPLFVTQMYEKLGVGWATSLLGFVALGMAPIPWIFYWMGPRLRARSGYEHGT